jgi:hypothetical protein
MSTPWVEVRAALTGPELGPLAYRTMKLSYLSIVDLILVTELISPWHRHRHRYCVLILMAKPYRNGGPGAEGGPKLAAGLAAKGAHQIL